jgi:leucyl aminopeptidase
MKLDMAGSSVALGTFLALSQMGSYFIFVVQLL